MLRLRALHCDGLSAGAQPLRRLSEQTCATVVSVSVCKQSYCVAARTLWQMQREGTCAMTCRRRAHRMALAPTL